MRRMLALSVVFALVGCLWSVEALAKSAPATSGAGLSPEVAAVLDSLAPGEMSTVIVTLVDQADLTTVSGSTRAARLQGVIRALQAKASASQTQIRTYLESRKTQGTVQSYIPFWISNMISVTATAGVIQDLAMRADVARIEPDDITVTPDAGSPEPNLTAIGVPTLWSIGLTGVGTIVASLDSGVDVGHPDLAGRWRGGTNSWYDPYGQHPSTPIDLSGHGTGTMGVMVGGDAGGTSIGVAPGAQWIAARIFNDRGKSTATAIHAAFQWLLDPDGNPATPDAPNVINNSWSYGSGPGCNLAFQPDLQALRAAGIVPVFAAGNFGPGSATSASPANYPEALAVGAVDNSSVIYSASSRGPSACGEPSSIYPEVVAPGVGIRTSDRYGMYQTASGTSLSAPHVAGALALLLSVYPNLTAAEQEAALLAGVVDLGPAGPDNTFGYGRVDVAASYAWLQNPPPTTTTTSTTTTTTTTTTTLPPTTTTVEADRVFADGFESGGVGAWSSATGSPAVVTVAALGGSYGMQASVSGTTSVYVTDTTPSAEAAYHAGFRFDPNAVVIPSAKSVDLLRALNGSGSTAVVVQIRPASGGYQVRAGAAANNNKLTYTAWSSISDSPHALEVGWSAASSAGGSDGDLTLWIDASQVGSPLSLSNGSQRIETLQMGLQAVTRGTAGAVFFDDFVSTRTTLIGP
jgi:subtilisin family serine protease